MEAGGVWRVSPGVSLSHSKKLASAFLGKKKLAN